MMFSEALEYSVKGKEVARTYTITGLLILLNGLIIPTLFLFGYLTSVSRETLQDKKELARFSDIKKTFVDGIIVQVILLAYLMPALVLSFFGGLLMEQNAAVAGTMLITGFTAATLLIALFPMAIAAYADKDEIAAAFQLKNLSYFLEKPFWTASISTMLYGIIGFFAVSTISITLLFTLIGIPLIPVVILAWVANFHIFGIRIYTDAYKEVEGI